MTDKKDKLATIRRRMSQDHETPLSKGTHNLVFGTGDPDADILLVGEAPGQKEDEQGEPFVGRAGGLLDKLLEKASLSRDDTYITNTVKYRPPRNRTPTEREASLAEPYLKAQIKIIDPNVVVTLGRFAAQRLTKTESMLRHLRGEWWTLKITDLQVPVRPLYHPAYLLRMDKGPDRGKRLKEAVESLKKAASVAAGESSPVEENDTLLDEAISEVNFESSEEKEASDV